MSNESKKGPTPPDPNDFENGRDYLQALREAGVDVSLLDTLTKQFRAKKALKKLLSGTINASRGKTTGPRNPDGSGDGGKNQD